MILVYTVNIKLWMPNVNVLEEQTIRLLANYHGFVRRNEIQSCRMGYLECETEQCSTHITQHKARSWGHCFLRYTINMITHWVYWQSRRTRVQIDEVSDAERVDELMKRHHFWPDVFCNLCLVESSSCSSSENSCKAQTTFTQSRDVDNEPAKKY